MSYNDLPFAEALSLLNTDRNPNSWDERTRGKAPHKAFLLLSIIDGIEDGRITSTHIQLDADLIETFFTYWNGIMGEDRQTTISLPFFHMKSEPFWELVYEEGMKAYKNSPSLGGLQNRLKYALIDAGLFEALQKPELRSRYRSLLLKTYFNISTARQVEELSRFTQAYIDYSELLLEKAAEPFEAYHAKSTTHRKRIVQQQVRDRGFRRTIRRLYQDTCALCGAKVITQTGESMIEGAHIIPWSESQNDDPRNGLALCGTHHWLFDNYMYTIRDDYRIKLSPWLKKKGKRIDGLLEMEGREIYLPAVIEFSPSKKAIAFHENKFNEMN